MNLVICPKCGTKMEPPANCPLCGHALGAMPEQAEGGGEQDDEGHDLLGAIIGAMKVEGHQGHVLLGAIAGGITPWAVGIVCFGAEGAIRASTRGDSVLVASLFSAARGVFEKNWDVLALFSVLGAMVGFLLASSGFRYAPVTASRVLLQVMLLLAVVVGPFGIWVLSRLVRWLASRG